MAEECFYGSARHVDPFGVHLMPFDALALHGLKRSGTHVQRQFGALDASAVYGLEHGGREMKAGRRRCHTTFDF